MIRENLLHGRLVKSARRGELIFLSEQPFFKGVYAVVRANDSGRSIGGIFLPMDCVRSAKRPENTQPLRMEFHPQKDC